MHSMPVPALLWARLSTLLHLLWLSMREACWLHIMQHKAGPERQKAVDVGTGTSTGDTPGQSHGVASRV